MSGHRVDVRALSVARGGKEILSAINLSFRPGELIALLGPSGSGKSTLLKAMLGLVKPKSGEVRIVGKAAVGYVPQDDVLHGALTVEKTLYYAAELRLPASTKEQRAGAITAVLAHVGLSDRRGVRVKNLSGGQRKRVSVAVELLAKPALFFLDEPTSGLDPALEEKMMQLLRGLTGPDRLTVVTTHVLASLALCDLAVIVAGGRLVYVGEPADAPAFFDAADMPSVYRALASSNAREWAAKLERSPAYRTFVLERA